MRASYKIKTFTYPGHKPIVSLVPAVLKAFEWCCPLTCYHIIPEFKTRTRWQAVDTFHEYPEQPEKAVVGINLPENAASLVMIAQ